MPKPSIKAPRPPAPPVGPATAFIAPLPTAASPAPDDAALTRALRALPLPEAKAILAAYGAFGNEYLFEARLIDALVALPLEGIDQRLDIHIARLGAEAYVLDVRIGGDKKDLILFISSLDQIAGGREPRAFVQFVVRRLRELSSKALTADMQRIQLDKTIDLLELVEIELDRPFHLAPFDSESDLNEYRGFLFEVMQKHYQLLLDGLVVGASGTRYKAALKQLEGLFDATTRADRNSKNRPKVPAFRIDGMRFRDYFDPAKDRDFAFTFYSTSAPPLTGPGPTLGFPDVLRKRAQQIVVLKELRPGPHAPGGRAFPDPPGLHDNPSWQAWARRMWDSGELGSPTRDALANICAYVSRYFHALTVHVPFDLAEGSKERSYLTRAIPRAITGALVHDCLVYAVRWIYILGQLFATSTMPASLSKPQVWLVEMPVHVGVMIRVRLRVGNDALIAINNEHVNVVELDRSDGVEDAARHVVEGMYAGISTPVLIHEITAHITDAGALWRHIAAIADRKAVLPYVDPSEPFLRYLRANMEGAKIERQVKVELGEWFGPMRERLDAVTPPTKRAAAFARELDAYLAAIPRVFDHAAADFETSVAWRADEIKADLEANHARLPHGAIRIDDAGILTDWKVEGMRYRDAVVGAKKLLELDPIDPEVVFPGDGFPDEVQ